MEGDSPPLEGGELGLEQLMVGGARTSLADLGIAMVKELDEL